MDKELKEILNRLLEGQTRLETELSSTSSRVENMEKELSNTSSRVENMEKELSNTSSRVENMEKELSNTSSRVENMEKELSSTSSRVENMEKELSNTSNRVENMERELNNNSIKLEDVEKKIKVIAEIQVAHKEQNERYLKDILQEQHNINTLFTSSLKFVSNEVVEVKHSIKELKEKFDKVEKVTMQNTYDVAYLKSVK
ncbi:hypothetical protein [Tissierella sp.]|uniref:hypothetical protein n=1 Tax=Tissierella sp. TaxID=41274 RepID=UPI0028AAB9C3|nr:hypothetical protein [Tissierella sp.]